MFTCEPEQDVDVERCTRGIQSRRSNWYIVRSLTSRVPAAGYLGYASIFDHDKLHRIKCDRCKLAEPRGVPSMSYNIVL